MALQALNCRLGVYAMSDDDTNGFVVIEHGRPRFEPVEWGGRTYVPGLKRWISELPQMVAPDGLQYVEAVGPSAVHLVGATGYRLLMAGERLGAVSAFTPTGILFSDHAPDREGAHPLRYSLVDPDTGEIRRLPPLAWDYRDYSGEVTGRHTGGSAAGYQPNGNSVWLAMHDETGRSSILVRFQLPLGTTSIWFDGRTDGSGYLDVVGGDWEGHPIVQLAERDANHTHPAQRNGIFIQTLRLDAPHQATVLNEGRIGDDGVAGPLSPRTIVDGEDLWLAADDGSVWMLRGGSDLIVVAAVFRTSDEGPPGVVISGLQHVRN